MESTNRRTQLVQTVVAFVALLIAGVGMIIAARTLETQINQQVLMHIGGAMVSGGLAFFLIEMFRWDRDK